ncbi:MAG: 50S ribosomal protein L18 [Candidatus Altiarchaeales archaeon ex4484_43]|nr:MAG: 50S ribosomal protein L18 [Candidatus Altiarchaeales archaeon ex4484_43]RLI90053.1 MAG: 50S ribosomal protein L18 [Candidatus Altiarchaeales archaeon]
MAKRADYVVPFRRRREGKTNYKKRLNLLKSRATRLVVRPSNKHMLVQLVDYKKNGDVIVSTAYSKELKKFGWDFATGNLPAAYLTGLLCGFRGQKRGVKRAILDLGPFPSVKGSRSYAALMGAIDSGLKIPVGEDVLPDEKRISGKHMSNKYENITEKFEEVKKKIVRAFKK